MYHVVNIGGKLVRIAFFGVKKLTCLIIKKEKMKTTSPLNNNINTAVILAAGRGERIAGGEEYRSKPLIKLYDLSLIERSIKKLSNKLKVNKIYVITGFKHDKLKIHLDKLKRKLTVDLEVAFAKEWRDRKSVV